MLEVIFAAALASSETNWTLRSNVDSMTDKTTVSATIESDNTLATASGAQRPAILAVACESDRLVIQAYFWDQILNEPTIQIRFDEGESSFLEGALSQSGGIIELTGEAAQRLFSNLKTSERLLTRVENYRGMRIESHFDVQGLGETIGDQFDDCEIARDSL